MMKNYIIITKIIKIIFALNAHICVRKKVYYVILALVKIINALNVIMMEK
jgi:hypothetical protein